MTSTFDRKFRETGQALVTSRRTGGGKPLESHEVIVNLIGNTTTKTGLRIQAALDARIYPTGIEVPDHIMEGLNMEKSEFHGEWNYRILPRPI